jgi:hypothetical protein
LHHRLTLLLYTQQVGEGEEEVFTVSLKYPELFPVLNWAKCESTRRSMDVANSKKCMTENVPLLERILRLRRGMYNYELHNQTSVSVSLWLVLSSPNTLSGNQCRRGQDAWVLYTC